jgi:hypothetical protein
VIEPVKQPLLTASTQLKLGLLQGLGPAKTMFVMANKAKIYNIPLFILIPPSYAFILYCSPLFFSLIKKIIK